MLWFVTVYLLMAHPIRVLILNLIWKWVHSTENLFLMGFTITPSGLTLPSLTLWLKMGPYLTFLVMLHPIVCGSVDVKYTYFYTEMTGFSDNDAFRIQHDDLLKQYNQEATVIAHIHVSILSFNVSFLSSSFLLFVVLLC